MSQKDNATLSGFDVAAIAIVVCLAVVGFYDWYFIGCLKAFFQEHLQCGQCR